MDNSQSLATWLGAVLRLAELKTLPGPGTIHARGSLQSVALVPGSKQRIAM